MVAESWRVSVYSVRPTINRYLGCVAGGALVPIVSTLAAGAAVLDLSEWVHLSAWRGLAPVGLLATAATLGAVAPLAGVAVVARAKVGGRGHSEAVQMPLALLAGAAACGASAGIVGLALPWLAGETLETSAVTGAAIVLACVAFGLAVGGAVLASIFRHPLDAAGCGVVVSTALSAGVIAMGQWLDNVPKSAVEWALSANPLFAVASAARIDLTRTDLLYQISPLAHAQFELPTWPATALLFLLASAAGTVVLVLRPGRSSLEPWLP